MHFDSKHKEIIIQKPKRANIFFSENNTNFFMAFKTWQKSTMFFYYFYYLFFFYFFNSQFFFNVITFYDFAEFLWWLWLCDCLDDVHDSCWCSLFCNIINIIQARGGFIYILEKESNKIQSSTTQHSYTHNHHKLTD